MGAWLQIPVSQGELDEIRAAAQQRGQTVSDWVVSVLREARAAPPQRSPEAKLAAIRRACGLDHPTGDIDQMLAEIEG